MFQYQLRPKCDANQISNKNELHICHFKLFHKIENLFQKISFLSLKNLFLCTDINYVKNSDAN